MILLIPVLPVLAADVTDVALSVTSWPPGTGVTITGSGFTAATFSVTFGSTPVIISSPISGGAISAGFSVPLLPRKSTPYNILVTATGDTVNVPTFVITSRVLLSNSSGQVGDQVTVSGNGFAASSTVSQPPISRCSLLLTLAVDGKRHSLDSISLQCYQCAWCKSIYRTVMEYRGWWAFRYSYRTPV